ncbi:MAG: cyclic nucleotide-binding domain-containing protein [Pseudomonadota bacterium]
MSDLPFLHRLPEPDRANVIAQMAVQRFGPHEIVIAQNDDSNDVFFVIEGMARVTIFSVDGKIVAFRDITAGDIFGELAAIDHAPRAASIVAVGTLRVGRLARSRFCSLIHGNAAFRVTLLQHLTTQVRGMTERIFEYSTMMVRERLVEELLRLAEAAGANQGEAALHPAPTHFDLATRISTHREAVSREMSRLAKLKLLTKKTGNLLQLDLDGLRALRSVEDNGADWPG